MADEPPSVENTDYINSGCQSCLSDSQCELDLSADAPITKAGMLKLTDVAMLIPLERISDLTGLEYATNLQDAISILQSDQ